MPNSTPGRLTVFAGWTFAVNRHWRRVRWIKGKNLKNPRISLFPIQMWRTEIVVDVVLFQNNKMLFGEYDRRMWRAFIKSMEFIEILWTRPVKTALYCLPRGFAGGRILISLSQGQCIGSGIEGGAIHKGRPAKIGIFRPPSPVCPV